LKQESWQRNGKSTKILGRQRIVKKHYDEMTRDHKFENAEEIFKIKVFFYVIDQVTGQIEQRFT